MTAQQETLVLSLLRLPLTFQQVRGIGRRRPEATTRHVLQELVSTGLAQAVTARVPAAEVVNDPLLVVVPGRRAPNFARICWLGSKRWSGPRRRTTFFVATRLAGRIFGIEPPTLKAGSFAHDQQLGAVYVHHHRWLPYRVVDWMNERELVKLYPGQPCPDAAVSDGRGGISLGIEIVGRAYTPARLMRLHRHFDALGVAYELR